MALDTLIRDARGNEFQGAIDTITGQTITDARAATVTLGSLNAESVMDLNGQATMAFDVRTGAMSATLVAEGTIDGVNYYDLHPLDVSNENIIDNIVITTTLARSYSANCSGFRRVRVRVSAYSSGNAVVALRASQGNTLTYARPIPTTLHVTATGIVNAAVTLTLPTPGSGLSHYITHIELRKRYSIIGVAAGAGVIITSTNLPGSPAWDTEQLAGPAGTVATVISLSHAGNPRKSSVSGTATTFVAPAQLETIWRWNVSYYVGA